MRSEEEISSYIWGLRQLLLERHPNYYKNYWKTHKDRIKLKKKIWNHKHPNITRDWKRNRKLDLVRRLGGSCQICGYKKNLAVLEFHHLIKSNPDERKISYWKYTFDKEVEKGNIRLLCSNCHKSMHHPDMDNLI